MKKDIRFLQGETIEEYDDEECYPVLSNFRKFMLALYLYQLILPAEFKLQKLPLRLEVYTPPKDLARDILEKCIQKNSPLTILNLNQNNSIDDELLRKIGQWNPEPTLLSIAQSYKITEQGLTAIIEQCPNLTFLNISECLLLTEKTFDILPHTLSKLYLNGLDWVTDAAFKRRIKDLGCLFIVETALTDQGLSNLPNLFPHLQGLALSLTNFSIPALLEAIRFLPLTRLILYDGDTLNDEEAHLLFKPHPYLRYLYLKNCFRLTDELFEKLQTIQLRSLHLTDAPHLTNTGLESILKFPLDSLIMRTCPNITIEALPKIKAYASKYKQLSINM